MKSVVQNAFAASAIFLALGAAHAGEPVSETRPVDARVSRIVLDSVVQLKVRQGAKPSLTVSGDSELVRKVVTEQSGDTLRVTTERGEIRLRGRAEEVRVELVVPQLSELESRGVGASHITGFTGDKLEVDLAGAGSVNLNDSTYKGIKARLSGVGSLQIEARNTENLDLRLPGAGSVTATGAAKNLQVTLSGVGSLDAKELNAEKARVTLSGLGSATMTVKDDANVTLSGLGSATVYGQPAQRVANTSGLGKVYWK